MSTLRKLLRQNLSIPQMAGYSLTALVGMTIIFTVFGFFMDVRPLFSSNTGLFKSEYMVVTKKVTALSTVSSRNTVFSDKEIEDIRSQNFVKSLSLFTACRYSVFAYMNVMPDVPTFSTELFFESVPDNLIDGAGDDWKWTEGDNFIPVIIPRDYLALYNFGFAGSRGLPQISEKTVSSIKFNVVIQNRSRKSEKFESKITGFSDYLNTILVPQSFMDWANANFGDGAVKVSKLLVEVKNPAATESAEFFAAKNYDVRENKGEQGKLSFFLKIIIIVVGITGLLIMLPAMGLMFLSINLLIYKNRTTLGNLLLLGYSRKKIAKPYKILLFVLNISIGVIAFIIFTIARNVYLEKLKIIGIDENNFSIFTVIFVVIFVIIITFADKLWIDNKIRNINPPARG